MIFCPTLVRLRQLVRAPLSEDFHHYAAPTIMVPSTLAVGLLVVVVTFTRPGSSQVLQNGDTCRLITMIPFSDLRDGPPPSLRHDSNMTIYGYGSWPNQQLLSRAALSLMASVEMARIHFNDRNSVLVPELEEEWLRNCPITIPSVDEAHRWYFDSGYIRQVAASNIVSSQRSEIENFILNHRNEIQLSNGETVNGTIVVDGRDLLTSELLPQGLVTIQQTQSSLERYACAQIGPAEPQAIEAASILADVSGIPNIAYSAMDHRLSALDEFPNLVRMTADVSDYCLAVAQFLQRDVFQREFIALLYDQNDYGQQFQEPFSVGISMFGYQSIQVPFTQGEEDSVRIALGAIVQKGYRTIVLVTDRYIVLEEIARVANEEAFNLIGPGYFWIISGPALPSAILPTLQKKVDSPIDRLLRGAALFTNYDRFVYFGESDPFLIEWRKQDPSRVAELNANRPDDPSNNNTAYYTAPDDYFQTETPAKHASRVYDAVMAVGIAACSARTLPPDTTDAHIRSLLASNFTGASGQVRFKVDADGIRQNSRDPLTDLYGIYNIRPKPNITNGFRGYDIVLTHLYEDGMWSFVANGSNFLFFDQTDREPMPLRTVADYNYLSRQSQVTGIFLASFAIVVSFATGLWVVIYRNLEVVKAGQPPFLVIICVGASMVGGSLFFFTFDESDGIAHSELDKLCATFPWFFSIGYLGMYCALFSKLWRLNKVLQMRRRAVSVTQVLLPFAVMMTSCVIVLLVWQMTDPLRWHRTVISLDPLETYGECNNLGHGLVPYVVPLGFLFATIMVMTAVAAWKMKDVQDDLSESRWVFYGIFSHLQMWAVGIPVLIITNGVSREVSYVMRAILTFLLSTTLVTLVIWPKIYIWARDRFFGGATSRRVAITVRKKRGSTRISGLNTGVDTPDSVHDSNLIQSSEFKNKTPEELQTLIVSMSVENQRLKKEVAFLRNQLDLDYPPGDEDESVLPPEPVLQENVAQHDE